MKKTRVCSSEDGDERAAGEFQNDWEQKWQVTGSRETQVRGCLTSSGELRASLLFYMWRCSASMCEMFITHMQCLRRSEGVKSHGTEGTDGCEPPYEC